MRSYVPVNDVQAHIPSRKKTYLVFLLSLLFLGCPSFSQKSNTPSSRRVLAGGTIINPRTDEVLPYSVISIRGERIEGVGKKDRFRASTDDEVIDCSGKFIIPGMIDAHIHLERWSCEYLISFGVTTVRDCGNLIPVMKHFTDKIQKAEWVGPRIFWGNPAIESSVKGSEEKDPWKIRDPAHAARLAEELIAQGVHHIKVYNRINEADLKAVMAVAKKHNIPVIGHFRDVGAVAAARLGVRSIEHGIGIPEDSLSEPLRLPADYNDDDLAQRFRYWQFVIWKSIDEKKAEHVADVLIDADVFVVSTLISDEVRRPEERQRELDFLWEDLPKAFRQYSSNPGIALDWNDEDYANFASSFKKEKNWYHDFYLKGGKIAAGTDSPVPFIIPGYSLHEELRQLASTGIPAMDVLKMATANAAELLGMQDQLGSVEEGRLADLVILDGNPLDDLKNSLRISKVIKSGKVYAPEKLRKGGAPERLR